MTVKHYELNGVAMPMDMKRLHLVIGVDQEGDANWDVCKTLAEAQQRQRDMAETAFEPPAIFRIDTDTCEVTEVK